MSDGITASEAPRSTGGAALARWVVAGALGGMGAALVDAGLVVVRGVGGTTRPKLLLLLVAAVGLLGLAGALVGGVVGLVGAALRRRSAGRAATIAALLAALAAAPLAIRNAFAMFSGHQAQQIPAHGLISAAAIALTLGAVFVAVRWFCRFDDGLRAGRIASRRGWMLAAALVLAGVLLHKADRQVLPRLYPWFHETLRVLCGVLAVLAARVLLAAAAQRRVLHRGWWVIAALTLPAAAVGVQQLRVSQSLRFAAHEKTTLMAGFLRAVPLPTAGRAPIATAVAAAALPSLPAGPRLPDADLVLITMDAVRSDHVGCYGYGRKTTPNLDELAARSVRFERAYAQAPHTSFSVSTILTGKYYPTLARLAAGEAHDPLPWLLRNYGWRTAAFYPPAVFYIDAQKLKAYEETHFQFEYVKFEYIDAERRVDQVIDYFETVRPKHAFVWVHFFEPHEPYDDRPEFHFGDADADRYDSEIAYTDAAVGRLLEYLGRERPRSVVVVTADHGEEFGEHGGRYHGSSLYEEQVRVPLIVSVPGVAGHVVSGPVQLVDLAPTLLNLIDIPPAARMRGTDLGPWLSSPPAPDDRLPPAFGEVEDKRMAVRGRDKLICDTNRGFCSLYDLARDPREQSNLADSAPERASALRGLMDAWLDSQARMEPELARGAANPDGGDVPRAIERGRLGDVTAATELAALVGGRGTRALRHEAAQLLVRLPARAETRTALVAAAADADPTIAGWGAVGALRAGASEVSARVRALASSATSERELRMRAALALAGAGDASGLGILGEYLEGCPEILVCREIYAAFGALHDERAVAVISKHLSEVQNRREMVEALGAIGSTAAVPLLAARLNEDEYVHVRIAAARALAAIGGPQAQRALTEAASRQADATVQAAVREATSASRGPAAGRP